MKRAVVRLPPDIIERLDLLAARLRAGHPGRPGRSCSRANVVRALIAGELDAAESPEGFDKLAKRALLPRKRHGVRGAGLLAALAVLALASPPAHAQTPTFAVDRLPMAGAPGDGIAVWRPDMSDTDALLRAARARALA